MVMSPCRVRAWTETLASDAPGSPCEETKLCTAPRSLLTSMEAAVPPLTPTSMFPEPFVSFA